MWTRMILFFDRSVIIRPRQGWSWAQIEDLVEIYGQKFSISKMDKYF